MHTQYIIILFILFSLSSCINKSQENAVDNSFYEMADIETADTLANIQATIDEDSEDINWGGNYKYLNNEQCLIIPIDTFSISIFDTTYRVDLPILNDLDNDSIKFRVNMGIDFKKLKFQIIPSVAFDSVSIEHKFYHALTLRADEGVSFQLTNWWELEANWTIIHKDIGGAFWLPIYDYQNRKEELMNRFRALKAEVFQHKGGYLKQDEQNSVHLNELPLGVWPKYRYLKLNYYKDNRVIITKILSFENFSGC